MGALFRQLIRSYMRFYSFVAQVIRLEGTGLEKLHTYSSWLSRLLPNREIPPDIEITEDMLRLQAFKVVEKEKGSTIVFLKDDEAALKFVQTRHFDSFSRGELSRLADKAGLPTKPVLDNTAAETVEQFNAVWAKEQAHLPLKKEWRDIINAHLARLPIVRELA